jgi:hypothetical protein
MNEWMNEWMNVTFVGFSRIYLRNALFKKQNPQQNISSGSVERRDLIPALKG